MFVVGTVQRVATEKDSTKFDLKWPVVIEEHDTGFVSGQVATRDSRDAAQSLADELNKVIADNP